MSQSRARPYVAVPALLLVCLVAACTAGKPAAQPAAQPRPPASPEDAVTGYYGALNLHLFTVADKFLAPGMLVLERSVADSPAINLVSLTQFRVDSSRIVGADFLPGLPDGIRLADYDTFAQVTVDYVATFRRVMSEPDGKLTRFLYLGRLRQGQEWQILTIGSGP